MNIKLSAIKRYEVMLYLFFMIVPVAAEEENQIIIEDIFQEIMLTLPPDIKADLDTVKKFSVNATSQKNGSEKVKNENAVELLL
ncbi:MAG: hypothetical protein JW795_05585, partial [Chitinivibrionales bacterium]|nr:hypothetical protein [Chitinivibrionales bacterium]